MPEIPHLCWAAALLTTVTMATNDGFSNTYGSIELSDGVKDQLFTGMLELRFCKEAHYFFYIFYLAI